MGVLRGRVPPGADVPGVRRPRPPAEGSPPPPRREPRTRRGFGSPRLFTDWREESVADQPFPPPLGDGFEPLWADTFMSRMGAVRVPREAHRGHCGRGVAPRPTS